MPTARFRPTVYHMKETGWEKISATNVGPLYHEYKAGRTPPHTLDVNLIVEWYKKWIRSQPFDIEDGPINVTIGKLADSSKVASCASCHPADPKTSLVAPPSAPAAHTLHSAR